MNHIYSFADYHISTPLRCFWIFISADLGSPIRPHELRHCLVCTANTKDSVHIDQVILRHGTSLCPRFLRSHV